MLTLFDPDEWIGEFYVEDYAKRFPGRVNYSPEQGIILDYSIEDCNFPENTKYLLGILSKGEKCTLFGNFNLKYSGPEIRYHGKHPFVFMTIGAHLKENDLFNDVIFTLTNLQEFFFPKGYKDFVKFSKKPLIELQRPEYNLSVENNASFKFMNRDITSMIYSHNTEALDQLKEAYTLIENKYPDSNFMLKEDISYNIHLTFNADKTIPDILNNIHEVADLFSVLTYKPVYPETIRILLGEDKNKRLLSIYPTLLLGKRSIDLIKKEKFHFHMPITNSKIDLPTVIQNWERISNNYSTLVSGLQHETNFRDEHSIHGEIVLYVTQLESISMKNGKKRIEKYEYPIGQLGSDHIRDGLNSIFGKINNHKLGKNIGDLRDEIAHVGKPKKLLPKLSLGELVYIGQYLQVIIISSILSELEIPIKIIHEYQKEFTPGLGKV